MTSVNSIGSQNNNLSEAASNSSSDTENNPDTSSEQMSLQEFNQLKRDGEKDGRDYYTGSQDDIRGVFSNLENTGEFIEVTGDKATIDTGRGDDIAIYGRVRK